MHKAEGDLMFGLLGNKGKPAEEAESAIGEVATRQEDGSPIMEAL
jgi:hypothetical protein